MLTRKLCILFILIIAELTIIAQNQLIDSLNRGLNNANEDTTKINFLNELSWEYVETNKIEEAIKSGEMALELSTKVGFTKGIATANSRLGNIYYTIGEFDKALTFHMNALKLKEQLGDRKGIASTCQNIGNIFQTKTNSKKAIEYYLRSLKIKEEFGDNKGIGNSLNSIGNIYKDQNDLKKSLNYYNQSLKVREGINDFNGIIYSLSNIATVYGIQKNYTKALEYSQKSLKISEQFDNKNGIAANISIISNIYKSEKNYSKAQEYNLKALALSEEMKNKSSIAMCLVNIGNVYYLDNNPKKGIEYLNKGLNLAKEIGAKDYIKGTYYNLAEVYEQLNDYKKALEYYKLYSELKDSILNDETNRVLAEKTTLYDNEKKEKEISLLKKEKEKQEVISSEEKKQQKTIILSISAVLFLVLLFSIYVYYALQRKKNANELLIHQKQLIEIKNLENETLLSEIHHRVKNNLQVISSLLSLQGKSIQDPGARMAVEEGKQRVKSMELVHKMLYEGTNFSSIEMNDYTNKLITHLANAFGIDKSDYEFRIESKIIKLDIDTAVPLALILNELIINAFKYAYNHERKLVLNLSIEETNKKLIFKFSDNGINNTDAELVLTSKSFGLKLIQLLTKQMNGTMILQSKGGLTYYFSMNEYKIAS